MSQPKLHLQQSQDLQLTPKLRQLVALLPMTQFDLERFVEEAIQDNPLLERAPQPEETTPTLTAAPSRTGQYRADGDELLMTLAAAPSFLDYLRAQICEIAPDERTMQLLGMLIESLDEHGYLRTDFDDIAAHAPLEWLVMAEDLSEAAQYLCQFDPAGVGARNLQQSLSWQLARKNTTETALAQRIVSDYFDELARPGVVARLSLQLKISPERIEKAHQLIQSLNPYPASGFAGSEETVFVRPDVRVYRQGNQWQVAATAELRPQVVVNPVYAQAVADSPDAVWKNKLNQAQMLTENLILRENTILSVAKVVVRHQQAFFDLGQAALRPLSLAMVADEIGIHESTVSRAINQKYLICPAGMFELRSFFTLAVGKTDEADEGVSQESVKACLQVWIEGENKRAPLTDEALRQKLISVDIDLSRRTIAKYRQEMHIPAAYYRRQR